MQTHVTGLNTTKCFLNTLVIYFQSIHESYNFSTKIKDDQYLINVYYNINIHVLYLFSRYIPEIIVIQCQIDRQGPLLFIPDATNYN